MLESAFLDKSMAFPTKKWRDSDFPDKKVARFLFFTTNGPLRSINDAVN
jgi:hypothetical protein